MRNIYTSIDIGSESVKIIVAEMIRNNMHILAAVNKKSKGIKKGLVCDADKAIISVKEAVNDIEDMLGFSIQKVILNIPSYFSDFEVVTGEVDINNEDMEVTGHDITNVLKDALNDNLENSRDLVSVSPIEFKLDDTKGIKDPKGVVGSSLMVKAVMMTTLKKSVYSFIHILEKADLIVVDLCFGALSDYEEFKNSTYDSLVGAVINIGSEITTVSVFNRGILIKSDIIQMGGKNIENDISYIYKINRTESKIIKEKFAMAHKKFTNIDDVYEVFNVIDEKLLINQYEVSEVAVARIEEILELSKNKINDLTKKKISYIIVSGGTSEMIGLDYLISDFFGKNSEVGSINVLGVRDNKYSSCVGAIKYFYNKLRLRGKRYSMIDELDGDIKIENNNNNVSVLGKVFGYFLDS